MPALLIWFYQIKFDWTLNVGHVGSIIAAVGVFVYTIGKFSAKLESHDETLMDHGDRIGKVENTVQTHSVTMARVEERVGLNEERIGMPSAHRAKA